jgi:hypothetical protein
MKLFTVRSEGLPHNSYFLTDGEFAVVDGLWRSLQRVGWDDSVEEPGLPCSEYLGSKQKPLA